MQPAPQQLVALGSHQEAPKRLLEPLQQQQHSVDCSGQCCLQQPVGCSC